MLYLFISVLVCLLLLVVGESLSCSGQFAKCNIHSCACPTYTNCNITEPSHLLSCSEGVSVCALEAPFVRVRGRKVYILKNNPVYRIKDILHHRGRRWRLDAISVLCEPRYKNTLLRRALVKSTSFPFDVLAKGIDFEQEVAKYVNEGDVPGHAYLTGAYKSTDRQIELAKNRLRLYHQFIKEIKKMYDNGECEIVDNTEMLLSVRLGDYVDNIETKLADVIAYNKRHPELQKVRVSTVLHYGNNEFSGDYQYNNRSKTTSVNALKKLLNTLERNGFIVELQSHVSADFDLCSFVFSKHFVMHSEGPGFGELVLRLRDMMKIDIV